MRTLIATMAIVTSGCASGAWIMPAGRTEQQARLDVYECQRDAQTAYPNSGDYAVAYLNAEGRGELHAQCMRAKGYRYDAEAEPTIEP